MCSPTFRGSAYLASSIFIYRGIQVMLTMAASLITGWKVTYLPISIPEECLLQLLYFIPLFTTSSFALMGVENDSYNFVLFSTVALSLTLLVRYTLELGYIYLINWEAYRLKTASLAMNIVLDSILVVILLCYVQVRLRHHQKLQQEMLMLIEEQEKERVVTLEKQKTKLDSLPKESLLQPEQSGRRVGVGIGQGFGQGVAIHYPCGQAVDVTRLERPLPPLPFSYKSSKSPSVVSSEYESVPPFPPSLPSLPSIMGDAPRATPDYDDL